MSFLAYVCGEGTGHIMEEQFCMGESLNGTNKLDIDAEKKLVDEKMKELLVDGRREGIAFAMMEFGMERYVLPFFFFFFIFSSSHMYKS